MLISFPEWGGGGGVGGGGGGGGGVTYFGIIVTKAYEKGFNRVSQMVLIRNVAFLSYKNTYRCLNVS